MSEAEREARFAVAMFLRKTQAEIDELPVEEFEEILSRLPRRG